jgi:aquaporin Z
MSVFTRDAIALYVSEFVGTFLLVFTVGCNVLTGSPIWAVTSIAMVLMVSIYALGGVSGGHFNPAVSVAIGLSSRGCVRPDWAKVGIYCAVQLVAGILAGLSYGLMLWDVFNLAPASGFSWFEAMIAEVLYTCMLCFVVLNVACTKSSKDDNQFYGLAIGFVVIAGGYGAGHISGGAFNPAVALGVDVSSAGLGFGWGPVYVLFELLGAGLAALLFRLVRPWPDEMVGGGVKLSTKLAAEFIGTFYLVLTVGLNVLGASPAPVWSIAASLMCMIFALGDVSGAHFNPAVTLAILLSGRGKITPRDAAAYMGIQILGGVSAALTYTGMEQGQSFPLGPGEGFGWAAVSVAEVVYTFVLCFVVLSVATSEQKLTQFFGLAIGSCVTAGGYAIGSISGGSLNPAVSVGISTSMVYNGGFFWKCLIYTALECVGAAMAAGVYHVTRPSEYSKSSFWA